LAIPGTSHYVSYPAVHGRLTTIKDVAADKAPVTPEAQWAVQGDRVLTEMETPPDNPLVDGNWWSPEYMGEPRVSVSSDIAKGLGLMIGDHLGFDLMGTQIDAKVASIREVDWRNYRMNFAFILSPGVLDKLPQTYLATVQSTREAEEGVLNQLSTAYPNVAIVRLREALQEVGSLVDKVASVINVIAFFALVMGALVMATAVSVTLKRRMLDHTLLKVLGATRALIMRILAAEFAVVGTAAAIAAALLGMVASYLMVTFVLKIPFVLPVSILLFTALLTVAGITLLGLGATWRSLKAKPLAILRND
jgi:putative ABC transport system permease protein